MAACLSQECASQCSAGSRGTRSENASVRPPALTLRAHAQDDMSPRRNEPRHGSVSSDALMHELLVGWERRNPWATAQR